jgi:MFS family permease
MARSPFRRLALPEPIGTEARAILATRALRAFADGMIALTLPLYLAELGFDAFRIGLVVTAILIGSSIVLLSVGHLVRWLSARMLMILLAGLMAVSGVAFAAGDSFAFVLAIAVLGSVSPSGGETNALIPLEQTRLAHAVPARDRTGIFARYAIVGSLAGAFGSLAAAYPEWLGESFGMAMLPALRTTFLVYAAFGCACLVLYALFVREGAGTTAPAQGRLDRSRPVVLRLAALFSLDAFGGGFIVQSMLALWLFQAFHLSTALAGTVFFWTGTLSALSYLVAVRIADRIGLVNTMVFTHLPSSLLLLAIPFVPDLAWVIALLLVRSALSQMDVPTRSSYVMAVVPPAERPAAASVTSVPRSLAAAASPVLAGWMLGLSTFAWPLVVAGGLKIAYDLMFLALFRKMRPPEEAERVSASSGRR